MSLKNKKLKMGYKVFDIVKEKEIIRLPNELIGEISYMDEIIRISNKISQNEQNQTFIHEMVHGLLDKIGYNEMAVDEKFVDRFSTGLYEIIKDNPHIFIMKDI